MKQSCVRLREQLLTYRRSFRFVGDAPSSIVAHAVSFAKGIITGTPADPADHKALKMQGATGKVEKKVNRARQLAKNS